MLISGIYKIQSLIKPDRIYIGSAVNISSRWSRHIFDLKNNKHHSIKLQNHYNKYGKNDLEFSIILVCDKEDLIITEQYYLDTENPYFNICKIAGSTLGIRPSKESIEKSRKGKIEAHKRYFNLFGKHRTPSLGYRWKQSKETIEKKSNSLKGNTNNKGKIKSEEAKLKQSKSRKGKCVGIDNYKSRQVFQYDKNMNYITNFISATEASKQTGIHIDSICRCALGKYKTGGGFIWRYNEIQGIL